jgi:UPF0716 protein FxsA
MRLPFVTKVAFVVWLVAEVAAFVLLVRWLGGWPVFWLMLASGFAGAWLIQREGARAWTSISAAMRSGRLPDRDLSSSRAVITGGFLLALPGFVTDALGLLLLIPATRGVVRRLWLILLPPLPGLGGRAAGQGVPPGRRDASPGRQDVPPGGDVIEGEIVESDDRQRGSADDPPHGRA